MTDAARSDKPKKIRQGDEYYWTHCRFFPKQEIGRFLVAKKNIFLSWQ